MTTLRHTWQPMPGGGDECSRCRMKRYPRRGWPYRYTHHDLSVSTYSASWEEPPCPPPDYTSPLVMAAPGTLEALIEGRKTVTRRLARGPHCRWRVGAISRIYPRSPRTGAKPVAEVKITRRRREVLGWITQPTYEHPRSVLEEGTTARTGEEFVRLFAELHRVSYEEAWTSLVWVIDFRLLRVLVEEARP